MSARLMILLNVFFAGASCSQSGEAPSKGEVKKALSKAVSFFRDKVATHGGYLWAYSGDLKLREGEGIASETVAWVQPPGTPAVGAAFLDAYDATGEKQYLDAALEAAGALLKGQLRSGGWDYHIEFDPAKRLAFGYRDGPKKAKQKERTTLDDDVSQSAVKFLLRLDKTLAFKNEKVSEAARFALESMVRAQYPNGGWYQWWKEYPTPASEKDFPVKKASYPADWSRKWLNDWTGKYYLNDNVMVNMILTMLQAHQTYGDVKYLQSALKAGDFLILAQMPQPQPAWAQQYNIDMHPVWDRKFEPPAITGGESQTVMKGLMLLYRYSGEKRFLGPIPPALDYLQKSLLPKGKLARFYELKTNRPLYFKRTGKIYDLTYSDQDVPDHYAFKVESGLEAIGKEYNRLLQVDIALLKKEPINLHKAGGKPSPQQVRKIINSLDERGAWVEQGKLRFHKLEPATGVVSCQTFITNVKTLSRFLGQK